MNNLLFKAVLGSDLEGELIEPQQIRFSGFASAGNTWEKVTAYRVWTPQTLNVMNMLNENTKRFTIFTELTKKRFITNQLTNGTFKKSQFKP